MTNLNIYICSMCFQRSCVTLTWIIYSLDWLCHVCLQDLMTKFSNVVENDSQCGKKKQLIYQRIMKN